MMINNKFNGYSRDGVRLYFDPATIASLATMMEGAGAASSAAAATAAAEAAAAAAAATTAATAAAPTMLETISGAMQAGTYPGAAAAPVTETAANTIPMITAGVPPSTGPIPGSEGIMQTMQAGPQQFEVAGEVAPNVMPPDGMNQGIFSTPTTPSPPPSLAPGQAPPGVAPEQGGYNPLNFGQTEGIPLGGTPEAGAGGLDSLGNGIEKAMKFMMKNATPISMGMQAISALGGQEQQGQKRSTFKPGYRLSPNFKPTLAPSAPSGVYGSGYNRRMAEGGITSDAEQPDYEGNISRFAQGGIASYAAGGTTYAERQAQLTSQLGRPPTAKESYAASVAEAAATKAAAPAAKTTAVAPGTQGAGTQASNFMTNPIGVLTGVLGREPTTAELQAGLAATKAGQPITAATIKTNAPVTTGGGITGTTTGGGTATTTGGGTTTGAKPLTVADLYTTYFKRPADEGGLASWTAKFGSEVDPTELAAFLAAPSTQAEIAAKSGTAPVTTGTTTTTDTTTTPRDPNVNPLSTSTSGTAGTYAHDMQGNIYNTATGVRVTQEEAARAAMPAFDINSLYRKYLGRNADESGIKTYDPSKYTAQQVSDFLMGSEEYKKQTLDPDEIQNAYRRILQRDVDPTGAKGYLGQNYSAGAFEDFLKQSQEYKEEVPFRTMERTVYKPEYEDYTKNPLTPGIATPTTLSYNAIQSQIGHAPTLKEIGTASAAYEANKPTTADQYLAQAKKGETGANMAKGGKVPATPEEQEAALQAKYAKMQGIKSSEESQADVDELVAYQKRMNEIGGYTDEDVDTRLLDPYAAAQVRLAKIGKKYKVPVTDMPKTGTNLATMAQGGITQNLGSYSDGGHLLKGPGDGMSDHIPAMIGKHQPARLADGEFVIPADVVSHLGNGSTEAGAKQLYAMMSRIRKARTGNPKQGKQVNPRKLMPK